MTQKRFYEAQGGLRRQLGVYKLRAMEARRQMQAFAAKVGAKGISLYDLAMRPRFMVVFTPDQKAKTDPKVWIRERDNDYRPRGNQKTLVREMEDLGNKYPSGQSIAEAIKMDVLRGMRWNTPGLRFLPGDRPRAFLILPDWYVVPEELTKQLKRISDIQFEKYFPDDKEPDADAEF